LPDVSTVLSADGDADADVTMLLMRSSSSAMTECWSASWS
jgi:hypothetical protein